MRRTPVVIVALLSLVALRAQGAALEVRVDAREAPRRILHADLVIPASPGPLTLLYPKWIPGEHGPNGPIGDLVNLRFAAGGGALPWVRDDVDMYVFHLNLPAGSDSVHVSLDFLLAPEASGFSSGASASSRLAVLSWNDVILYPQGARADALTCVARAQLPKGWSFATALPVKEAAADTVEFSPVSLATLVDSPVLLGKQMKTFDLSAAPRVSLHLAAEKASALELKPEVVSGLKRLVVEAQALFGARHFDRYQFLCALSDRLAHFGLEHHESSDDRVSERAFVDPGLFEATANLMPHEFVHSWNGKYRRPEGLVTPDFQQPMRAELLWVYEGLTEYLGDLLTTRSGLWTTEEFRENLARELGELDHRPGRAWRSLRDTSVEAQVLLQARPEWASLRRGADFYDEGELIWLEVDVTLRTLTKGRRSIDDFCKAFFGGESGPATVRPYTLDDVISTLNVIGPSDWRRFFESRIDSIEPRPPTGGIERAGWRVITNDTQSSFVRAVEESLRTADFTNSIGGSFTEDGRVVDVVSGMELDRTGLAPGMRITAIGDQRFSVQALRQALKEGVGRKDPILLTVENGDDVTKCRLDYHGGEKYPRLERDPSLPDLLEPILAPRASGRRN